MGDELKRMLAGLGARWNGMGSGQRFMTVSLLAGAVITIAVTAFLAQHATYVVLYAGLDPDQASAVVEELRSMGVSYRLSDSGRTIRVPEKDVYATRLDLAGQGLPGNGGSGYEIFDNRGFGMTNFMQQVNYRRALEGELARTISEMDEILGVRVHLVIPERSLFMDESRTGTASVMLRMKPGVQLSRRQTQGISSLVAGSVEGLAADDVNIVDYYGNLLAGGQTGEGFSGENLAQLEAKSSIESWYEEKAQTLLDRVLGPGNSVVRVTAELDFERLERDVEMFDPDNAVIRSEELSEESKGGDGGEFLNSVTNYEINRTVEKLVKAPGTVERLTVAVTVDGRYETPEGEEGEEGEARFVPRPDAELRELEAIAKNAVGFNERRGDQFHIACIQFADEYLVREQKEMKHVERQVLLQTVLRYGFLLLAVGLGSLVLLKIFRSVTGMLAGIRPAPVPGVAGAAVEQETADRAEIEMLVGQVTSAARNKPEESATLIRNMIAESD
ncbi:MAG: flagellar M-ring protein FliF [Candidatus Eisenbacteria sp.]|nr:flagellar M-ring protein FliF [Candidatus Eisenbacteria bacterium]